MRRVSVGVLVVAALASACFGREAEESASTAELPPPATHAVDASSADAAEVRDAGDAPTLDAGPVDGGGATSCIGPCVPGQSRCDGDGIATCTRDPNGCNAWGAAVACATNQTCTSTLQRATCGCKEGTALSGGACVVVIGAPRAIAPLSTATVTSRAPTLHWSLATGTDGAEVDVCRDRACSRVVTTFMASGTSGAPPTALAAGTYFWRLRGVEAGQVGTLMSPVWQFVVGARSALADSSWGTDPDVDGDGISDVVVGNINERGTADLYIYPGGAGGLATTPTVVHGPTTGAGSFGIEQLDVVSAGDVDGDGYADIVVAAYGFDVSDDFGTVDIYRGGPDGLSADATQVSLEFGYIYGGGGTMRVASAGDVNGDGYADVIAGTPSLSGVVDVFLGGAGGLSTVPITMNPPATAASFGSSIASAGDLNGDGYADIIIGDGTSTTYVYVGGPNGPSPTTITLIGAFASGGGDVNGDGLADIVVGPNAAVYYGASTGVALPSVVLAAAASAAGDEVIAVSTAGDVNGDGFADVLVGAISDRGGDGSLYLYLGSVDGPTTLPLERTGAGTFGRFVASGGDVDGDGLSDVLVGVDVFFGTNAGLTLNPLVLGGF